MRSRTLIAMMCATLASAAMVVPQQGGAIDLSAPSAAQLVLDRFDGADRYATSVRISQETFPAGADTVFLATGESFPDALAAGPAAAALDAPILLTATDQLPAGVRAELQRLDPTTVYLLGGTAAISAGVEAQVDSAATGLVRRISGSDRWATAAEVTELAFPTADAIYVAAGTTFADALSAGAPGGILGRPVLLTATTLLPGATRAQITRLANPDIIVLGGTAVVSNAVVAELDALTTGAVRRVNGANRYTTSAAVSADAFTSADTVFLATGTTFPDALSAAPAAAAVGAPILLTTPSCAPAEIISEVARLGANRVIALGGPNAVSDAAAALTPCSARPGEGLFASSVNPTTRQIEDQNGDPWFGIGDAAWSLVGQLSPTAIETYLDGVAAAGVNFVMFSAPEANFTDNSPAYRNQQGDLPFTGAAFQSSLNDAYWSVVDDAVAHAGSLGITVLLCPQYIGYNDNEGWGDELTAAYNADPQNLTDYGRSLAARYPSATYPNIVWLIGHDRPSMSSTHKAASKLIADQLPAGHLLALGGDEADTYGDASWSGAGITSDFDTVYDYDENPGGDTAARWPSKAVIFMEGKYEQEQSVGIGAQLLREQVWSPWMAGASASIFGNNPRWHFESGKELYPYAGTWQQSITNGAYNDGTAELGYVADFVSAVPDWGTTVPDTGRTFLTGGSGRARFDALTGIVYSSGAGAITLDTTELAANGNIRIRRFDPTTGVFTTVSASEAQSSSRTISYPGANSSGATDYTYLIDLAP